jgi:hypothetical protein
MLQGIIETANIKLSYQIVTFKNFVFLSCTLLYCSFWRTESRVSLTSVLVIFLKMVIRSLLNILIGLNKLFIIIIIYIIKSKNSRPACSH